jgi:hypothetical protein
MMMMITKGKGKMRAKIIATAAGVALAIGGVGLAQSSFASETTTQSTQSAQTPASPQNGVIHGAIVNWSIATGVGHVLMSGFRLNELLVFTASNLPGGIHGAAAHSLQHGQDVLVTFITLGNGQDLVTRIVPA